MFINLLNHSTEPRVTEAWLTRVTQAVTKQLQEHFCPIYGLAAWSLSYDPTTPYAGSPNLAIFDSADQAGFLGYHATDPQGLAYGKVFIQDIFADGGTMNDGASVSGTISHEALEMVGDLAADRFRLALDGVARAEEACDAVEDHYYEIDGISVSDFVTPSWYSYGGHAPYDHMAVLTRPLSRTSGGYIILLRNGVTGTDPSRAAERKGKQHPASRTARRLARAAA
jgi:hypothetical protein